MISWRYARDIERLQAKIDESPRCGCVWAWLRRSAARSPFSTLSGLTPHPLSAAPLRLSGVRLERA